MIVLLMRANKHRTINQKNNFSFSISFILTNQNMHSSHILETKQKHTFKPPKKPHSSINTHSKIVKIHSHIQTHTCFMQKLEYLNLVSIQIHHIYFSFSLLFCNILFWFLLPWSVRNHPIHITYTQHNTSKDSDILESICWGTKSPFFCTI